MDSSQYHQIVGFASNGGFLNAAGSTAKHHEVTMVAAASHGENAVQEELFIGYFERSRTA
jgi:hypothetical protein